MKAHDLANILLAGPNLDVLVEGLMPDDDRPDWCKAPTGARQVTLANGDKAIFVEADDNRLEMSQLDLEQECDRIRQARKKSTEAINSALSANFQQKVQEFFNKHPKCESFAWIQGMCPYDHIFKVQKEYISINGGDFVDVYLDADPYASDASDILNLYEDDDGGSEYFLLEMFGGDTAWNDVIVTATRSGFTSKPRYVEKEC